jgi:Protein of unknown function (DUF2783)
MPLIRTPQLSDPDGFYEELVRAQRDLPDDEAQKVLAKLVLILANHVGDRQVLSEAIALASQSRVATQTPEAAAR